MADCNKLCEELQACIDRLFLGSLDIEVYWSKRCQRIEAENARMKIELQAMRGAANSYKAENERLKKERDAAVQQLKEWGWSVYGGCEICKYIRTDKCKSCKRDDVYCVVAKDAKDNWQWRGVSPDEEV